MVVKLEDALIHSYSMLVMRGRCKITDIPEEYRTEVRDYITIDMQEEPNDDIEFVIDDKGPLVLPKLELTFVDDEPIMIKEDQIFGEGTLNGKEKPDVIKYDLVRIEPQVLFEVAPTVKINKTLTGFRVQATGVPRVHIEGYPSLSALIRIHSSNYEDMNLTLYITLKTV